MTLPKGYGGRDPKSPQKKLGFGKGKKIGAGVGVAVAVLVALGLAGLLQSGNNASLNAPMLADMTQTPTTNETSMRAAFAIDKDPIGRGDIQTIRVSVTDEDGTVTGASVFVEVFYSGETIRSFSGTTDEDGYFTFSWQIGGNSNPGVFNVNAVVTYFGHKVEVSGDFAVTA